MGKTKIHPTADMVIAEVRYLAADSPDCVYNRPNPDAKCFYHKGRCSNGTVGCIFGQALRALGVSEQKFRRTTSIEDLLRKLNIPCSADQGSWMSDVQSYQDQGFTWRQSVIHADKLAADSYESMTV